MRERILAELELMASTGRQAEAYWQAVRLLHSRTVPGSADNDPNPLKGDWHTLEPYLNFSGMAVAEMQREKVS
jgi:hypothetical protein